MEPSITSFLNIESLHADSLVWTEKTIQLQENGNQSMNQLSRINKTGFNFRSNPRYQNDQMFSYIKPDYGSLGQFITDINLNTDFLRQKKYIFEQVRKKNDGQQQVEQKKLRQHIQNKNLNKILSNAQSSNQERSVACKLLIERSFEEAFGTSINQFYQQTGKKLEIDQNRGLLNLNALSDALDEIVSKSKEYYGKKPKTGTLQVKPNMRRDRSFMKNNTFLMNQKQNALKRITDIKNNYRALAKYSIPESPSKQFSQLTQRYSSRHTNNTYVHHHHQPSYSQTQISNQQVIPKIFQGKAFLISPKQVIINNLYEVSCESLLYGITKMNFQTIEEFSIINTSFPSVGGLFLVLDLIGTYAKNLKILVIQDIQIILANKHKQKLSQKIKCILQNSSESIQVLKLNKIGLQTKDFCILCLGIGSSRKLQIVQMKDNKIDEHGKKSYDVISKFFKNLQINLQGNILYAQITKNKLRGSRLSLK